MLESCFKQNTIEALGAEAAARIFDAIENGVPSLSVRCNPDKISVELLAENFGEIASEPVPWCRHAIYLESRPAFALDPWLHAGAYYVQEAASMAVGALFNLFFSETDGIRALDLCAAPGGKSLSILSEMSDNSLLVSNEVIRSRAGILEENIKKWGSPNVVVTSLSPDSFGRIPVFFDLIIADVPCSGEGMFRKDPDTMAEWSQDNVALCAARGRKIVADAWPSLKPGGLLFYSTCTFNRFENDENVEWIARTLGADIVKLEPFEGATPIGTEHGLQFAPGITRGEGLYCAVLRKNGNAEHTSLRNCQIKSIKTDLVKQDYMAINQNGLIKAYTPAVISEMKFLEEKLRVMYSGVDVVQQKGRDMVPQPELALSKVMNDEIYPVVQLTKEQALNYLRHNLNSIPNAPSGFVTMAYNGIRLGFAKNLGSRMNIIHPLKWRLLK